MNPADLPPQLHLDRALRGDALLAAVRAMSAPLDSTAGPADYGLAIRAMAEASRVCGATGFMMWCQAVCGLYLQQSGNPTLMGDVLQRHASGAGMGGTALSNPMKSYAQIESLLLKDHFIGTADTMADPTRPFIARIRAAFVMLQCGMAVGITQGAIDSMWAVEAQLGHVNQFLEDRPDALQAELDALTARVMQLAQTPFDTSTDFFIDVLDARAHGAELCLRAAQSALMHQGARGYLMSSDVQRRVRESHFVAIVTPAIKHLRKEIARLSTEEMPA